MSSARGERQALQELPSGVCRFKLPRLLLSSPHPPAFSPTLTQTQTSVLASPVLASHTHIYPFPPSDTDQCPVFHPILEEGTQRYLF